MLSRSPRHLSFIEELTVKTNPMDPVSLATALAGAQMSNAQMAIAAKMVRMNADNAASVVQVLDAAQKNMASLANVAIGIGQNLNISI